MEPAQIDRIRARTRGAHGRSVWRVFAFCVCCAAAPLAADETDGKVVVSGIPNSFRADALARIQLDDEPCNASRRRIQRLLAVAQDDIRKVLEIEGYYSPTVVAESSRQQNCWRVAFDIDIGPPVLIRNVIFRIDGEGSDDRALLKSHDPELLLPGQRLQHADYETS